MYGDPEPHRRGAFRVPACKNVVRGYSEKAGRCNFPFGVSGFRLGGYSIAILRITSIIRNINLDNTQSQCLSL